MANSRARTTFHSADAPKAIGPYSQAVGFDSLIFSSGQIGIDPNTAELVPGGVEAQTRQALVNLTHVLAAAGVRLKDVVKTTVFLAAIEDFAAMNAVYAEFLDSDPPARSTVAVRSLPKGALVEIEAVAVRSVPKGS